MKKGVLFILCGPSGVGKTSLCEGLMARRPRLTLSVSYTTRAPRPGDVNGEAYHFIDAPTFLGMRDEGAFSEWAEVHGNYYGTATRVLHEAWMADRDVLFDIDYQGARQLKERFPHACSVLVIPPDMETLEQRLRGRQTDSEAVIARRLAAARHELAQYAMFDFVVENGELEPTLQSLVAIYDAARHATPLWSKRVDELLSRG